MNDIGWVLFVVGFIPACALGAAIAWFLFGDWGKSR